MLRSAPFEACEEHGLPTAASKKDAMEAGIPYTFDYFSLGNARLVLPRYRRDLCPAARRHRDAKKTDPLW